MKKVTKLVAIKIMSVLFLLLVPFLSKGITGYSWQPEGNYLTSDLISFASDPNLDIEKAKKDGKAVFLVITGNTITGVDKALNLVKEASAKVSKSVIIQLNKDDAANKNLVSKLGIANVPVPFILVISQKGVPVAGFEPGSITSDNLIKSIPSPKQDEALLALSEKKPVFMIVSQKGLTDKNAIITNCKSAAAATSPVGVIIEIDYNDTKEAAFIKQIGVTAMNGKTKTIVANSAGQITATYEGSTDVPTLTASANKVVKSGGCCPGGSSSGCGTKK